MKFTVLAVGLVLGAVSFASTPDFRSAAIAVPKDMSCESLKVHLSALVSGLSNEQVSLYGDCEFGQDGQSLLMIKARVPAELASKSVKLKDFLVEVDGATLAGQDRANQTCQELAKTLLQFSGEDVVLNLTCSPAEAGQTKVGAATLFTGRAILRGSVMLK